MRVCVLGLVMLLAGCADKGAEAESRYNMVAAAGTKAEKCEEAGRVEEGYLSLGNEPKYREWRKVRETQCLYAEIDARARVLP